MKTNLRALASTLPLGAPSRCHPFTRSTGGTCVNLKHCPLWEMTQTWNSKNRKVCNRLRCAPYGFVACANFTSG